ncbi:S8 family serine peptidase [Arthrobacter glacialis]|uniref:Peptidase S8 n=1 Tax=Arthrobacter glacialis TaxID=1664 RepID=A0A2S3ZUV3_ARTGL|nr:S8 family serine peptidase [Arthrobacter glacialis]POH72874.1 peptidase S8 [Arthrobacter glacialis]
MVSKAAGKKAVSAGAAHGAGKGKGKASSPPAASKFPDRIFAMASPQSVGGVSMFTPGLVPTVDTLGLHFSDDEVVERAIAALSEAGFEVLQATNLMVNFCGSRALFDSAFGAHLYTQERPVHKPGGVEGLATFIDNADTDIPGLIDPAGTVFEGVLDGIAIEEPYYLHTADSLPPTVNYFHLNVPDDVSVGLNAEHPHRSGITGKGVKVAMVDTGFQTHPFFTEHGYLVQPTTWGPGTADPTVDENGHGTGESANIFATAPDVTLFPVKTATATGALVNVTAAFNAAVALGPDIITNSWGSDQQNGPLSAANQALAAAVAAAVSGGITVVFSAGNGGWGFPGQHPDVISVGGVNRERNGALRASNYTSGFMSNIYAGRRVPDVSGLVGMLPRAMYIMLPIPEGCAIDVGNGGGTHPNGDQTLTNDGWAAFSGTSAAAPQIAGVCALIRQTCPRLNPAAIRDILMTTAQDVTAGTNHPNFGNVAVVGPDTATGHGLVDAHRAVLIAKLRCRIVRPVRPLPPIVPVIPFRPPFGPIVPVGPIVPIIPFRPPFGPIVPVIPFRPPVGPIVPIIPFRPPFGPIPPIIGQDDEGRMESEGMSLTDQDVTEIERFIIESPQPPEL